MLTLIFHSYRHQNSFLRRTLLGSPRINRTELQEIKANSHLVTEHLKPSVTKQGGVSAGHVPRLRPRSGNRKPDQCHSRDCGDPDNSASWARCLLSPDSSRSRFAERPVHTDDHTDSTLGLQPAGHPAAQFHLHPRARVSPGATSSTVPCAWLCLPSIVWWVTCP